MSSPLDHRFSSIVEFFRDAPWLTRRVLKIVSRIFVVVFALAVIAWLMASAGLRDPHGHPVGADFIDPWSASWLALHGNPAAVYDVQRLWAVEASATYRGVGYAGFHYPPTYLLIVLPLATMPYAWALLLWAVATLALYVAVILVIEHDRDAIWLALAFPGVFVNLTCGQNGFITLVLLGGGLLALDSRPILSGILFGLMTYKPQYAVLIPLFLIVTGRWRVLWISGATALIFAGLSLLVFGLGTWHAFFGSIAFTRVVVLEQGGSGFGKLQSAFAAMRLWGTSVPSAYFVQAVIAIAAVLALLWICKHSVNFEIQATALVIGVMLMSPYMMDYDLVMLALPIAWLSLDGLRNGFRPFDKSILALAWTLPMFARTLASDYKLPLAPPLLLALLVITVRRAMLARRTAATDVAQSLHAERFDPVIGLRANRVER
jgi:glycosyl transferase family 87